MKRMARPFLYAAVVLSVLAAVWFGGGTGGQGAYRVEAGTDGQYRLTLIIPHPGLFEDLRFGPVLAARAGSGPAPVMKPWPGDRVRAFSLYRGPLVVTLAEGAGPFRVSSLPLPMGSADPAVELPDGWRQVGAYVGRLILVDSGPIRVAVPEAVAKPKEAADQAATLYKAGVALVGELTKKEPILVLPNAETLTAADAVMDHLLPGYGGDLSWWRDGLREYGMLRLMDQAKLWTNTQHQKWLKDPARTDGFRLVLWLDMSLKAQEHKTVDDLLRSTATVANQVDFLAKLKAFGNLSIADTLERMLKGREPMPSMAGK